jgi:N-acetylneuraminic acid mutarotase
MGKTKIVLFPILFFVIMIFSIPFVSAVENSWKTLEQMPTARGRLGVAVVNGKIYAIGGDSGSYFGGSPNNYEYMGLKKFVSANEEYNPSFDNWTSKASMPTSRYHFATAVYDDKIYCIGGLTVENETISETGINEVYDPETDTWEQKASMPTPRMRLDASVVNGKIYLIGGHTVSNYIVSNSCDVYDPISDSWTTKELSPPHSFVPEASVVIDNKIYFLGKKSTQLPPYIEAFIQIYDPETDVWTTGNPAPLYTSTASVCATTGIYAPKRMHVFDPDGHYVYDPASDTWTNATQMPTIRGYTGVGVINDTIYVVGGILLPPKNILIGEISSTPANEQYTPIDYVPEFSSLPMVLMILIASSSTIICKRKLTRKNKQC